MYSSINSRSTFFLKAFFLSAYFSLSRAFLTMIMSSTCFWVLYDQRTWQSAIVVACEWHARAVRLARSRRILQMPAEFFFVGSARRWVVVSYSVVVLRVACFCDEFVWGLFFIESRVLKICKTNECILCCSRYYEAIQCVACSFHFLCLRFRTRGTTFFDREVKASSTRFSGIRDQRGN